MTSKDKTRLEDAVEGATVPGMTSKDKTRLEDAVQAMKDTTTRREISEAERELYARVRILLTYLRQTGAGDLADAFDPSFWYR